MDFVLSSLSAIKQKRDMVYFLNEEDDLRFVKLNDEHYNITATNYANKYSVIYTVREMGDVMSIQNEIVNCSNQRPICYNFLIEQRDQLRACYLQPNGLLGTLTCKGLFFTMTDINSPLPIVMVSSCNVPSESHGQLNLSGFKKVKLTKYTLIEEGNPIN